MNKNLLKPLLAVVLQNEAIGGTNRALLHIIDQNKLVELAPSLAQYLLSDELFYEQKAGTIINHSPQEFTLLAQEKYLAPVINFAAGRAYNSTVLQMQKEYGITEESELTKLKSIISDMYLEGCHDEPDLHKIKALSSTLLSSFSNSDKFLLTSQNPDVALNADDALTSYSFADHPNYRYFEAALAEELNTPMPDENPDEQSPEEENYIPPKIDLSVAEANRQATMEHDAALYPYAWPHSGEF